VSEIRELVAADTIAVVGARPIESDADRHLSTDHLRGQVKHRAISGGVVTALAQGGQLALTFGYNIVLARLLTPRDFGLVAMVLSVGGFLQIFKDAGLSTATIQREEITQAQVSNLFWINVGVSAAAALTLAAAAPLLAWFFHQPEVASLAIVMSLGFVFEGLAVQHLAILNRQMRFQVIAGIELGSIAAGFAIGIVMALTGFGYWSLVGATLSNLGLRLIAAWVALPWRPRGFTRRSGTRPLLHFGADLTAVGVLYAVSRGSDTFLIGRVYGSDAVGLYSRATALLTRPMERLISPIYQVIVPTLSRLQTDPPQYRATFLNIFEGLAIAGFLFAGLFFPLAHPIVLVVLGAKWAAAAPIFAAFATAALFLPLSTATSWVYTSQGRGRELVVTAAFTSGILIGSFAIGLFYGPTAVAIGYSLSGLVLQLPLTFYIAGRKGPVTTRDLWLGFFRHTPVLTATVAGTWLAMSSANVLSPFQQIALGVPAGIAAAAAAMFLWPPSRQAAIRMLAVWRTLRGGAAAGVR